MGDDRTGLIRSRKFDLKELEATLKLGAFAQCLPYLSLNAFSCLLMRHTFNQITVLLHPLVAITLSTWRACPVGVVYRTVAPVPLTVHL